MENILSTVAADPTDQFAQATLDAITDPVIAADDDNQIQYANPAATRLFHRSAESMRGAPLATVLKLHDTDSFQPLTLPDAQGRRALLVLPSGQELFVKLSNAPITLADQQAGKVLVLHDVSAEHHAHMQLSTQARHDPLTGLVNRKEFEHRLARVLNNVERQDSRHGLLYLDLDRFKRVNDSCGHAAGDELLRQLATLLLASLRGRDTLARLGGDEFAVILEHCTLDVARQVAEKLRQAVQNFRFTWDDQGFSIGVSIGLVIVDDATRSVTQLLAKADQACFAAKHDGRNRVYIARDEDSRPPADARESQLADPLRLAMESSHHRTLALQPIMDITRAEHTPCGYEALFRVRHSGELINAADLLSTAERCNLAKTLDTTAVFDAIETLQGHNGLPVFVNVSEHGLADADFAEVVKAEILACGITAHHLCFEIQEETVVNHLPDVARFVNVVSTLGCRFAMDRVGASHSALYLLGDLGFDYLKLDGRLLADTVQDDFKRQLAEAIITLADSLSMQVIACPVADEELLAHVRQLGIGWAQGYALGSPAPVQQLDWLHEYDSNARSR